MMKNKLIFISLLVIAHRAYPNPTGKNSVIVKNYTDDLEFTIQVSNNSAEIQKISYPKARGTDETACTITTFPDLPDDYLYVAIARQCPQQLPNFVSYFLNTRSPRKLLKETDPQTTLGFDKVHWCDQLRNNVILITLISHAEQRHIVASYQKTTLGKPDCLDTWFDK